MTTGSGRRGADVGWTAARCAAMLAITISCSGTSAQSIGVITYSIHASSPLTSLDDQLQFSPDGTVRFRTISPASMEWGVAYPVGEFVVSGEAALYGRLRTALAPSLRSDDGAPWAARPESTIEAFTAETTDRGRTLYVRRTDSERNMVFDQWRVEFDRLRQAALAHPVNAVRLGCRQNSADLRCRLDAVGTQTSRVPLPAWTAPYSFWCFDRDRHLTHAADVGAPAPGPPTTIDLKPGDRYEIALPAGTRCDGSLLLSIRSPSPESALFNTVAIPSGPIGAG